MGVEVGRLGVVVGFAAALLLRFALLVRLALVERLAEVDRLAALAALAVLRPLADPDVLPLGLAGVATGGSFRESLCPFGYPRPAAR